MTTILEFQGAYRFLSNFYVGRSTIKVGTFSFLTAEHLYQAFKTADPKEAIAVEACATPGAAKRMGQTLTLRRDWDQIKLRAMEITVSRKFLADTDLIEMLLDTGDAELVEGNKWHDNYWGACYCQACANQPKLNNLGMTIMKFRDSMREWTSVDI